jgi:hypothetical protein
MNWFDSILGVGSTPNSTAANSNVSGATTSNQSSLGSFLSGLVNLGNQGVNAYRTVADAGTSNSGSTTTSSSSSASASSWTKYLPWVLIGGGVLLIFALFRRAD